ncbi:MULTISPECIES: 3TM-type holin [Methylobacter]
MVMGIDDAIAAGATLIDTVVKRVWPDATEVEKAKLAQMTETLQAEWNNQLAQIEVNKIEAASTSLLVSGWRPAIGWVCAAGLAYAAILEPLARFAATVVFAYVGAFPVIDTEITLQILFALLGLGGMRTYEKARGVHAR